MRDETKCLHAGYTPGNAEPRVLPIVQSTTYVYDSTEEVAAVFDDPMKSLIYSRFGNPTVMAVEEKIAELEGGIGAMCTTSGQAATLLSLLNICNAGDSFISTTEIYGGSINLFSYTLKRLGIECIYIDKNASDEEISRMFKPNTKAVFGETLANPALTVFDIERFAKIAHQHQVPLIVDNTFATPILCKPFAYGADIIVHSTSKYMDGHAVQIGGAIVDSGNFDWTCGKFPDLTEPDESYHGISYTDTYGKKAYIVKARMQLMRDFGVYPAAHSAFLLNLGLETLAVRMKQYCENAMTVARYLEQSPYVEQVNYPGLESDENYALANAVCYSKYHLHRMFTDMVGITLHDYIQRRQLTEAAKLLVFSEKPIIEIALIAGYESQQAFTSIFKTMYKQTPLEYRQNEVFYPLQLEFTLNKNPTAPDTIMQEISYATLADIPDWMNFITLVIDGFPCLDESSHLEQVKQYIQRRQALIMRDGATIIGAAAFSYQTGSIDFLAVHPQYRHYGVAKAFLDFMMCNLFVGREISITTFREGDKADTGQREEYKRLGFAESELLTEFGYPTQRLILPPKQEKDNNG